MRRMWLLAPAVLLLAGCATNVARHNVTVYHSDNPAESRLRRVVIVPLGADLCTPEESAKIAESLSLELQKAKGYDIVLAKPADRRLAVEGALWRRGRVDANALIEARERYRADAFLFGTITHYKAYDPPLLGIKIRLLSATSGDVLWSADGLFDAADNSVRADAMRYFRRSGMKDSLYGPELILMSPRLFSKYVVHEMVSCVCVGSPT